MDAMETATTVDAPTKRTHPETEAPTDALPVKRACVDGARADDGGAPDDDGARVGGALEGVPDGAPERAPDPSRWSSVRVTILPLHFWSNWFLPATGARPQVVKATCNSHYTNYLQDATTFVYQLPLRDTNLQRKSTLVLLCKNSMNYLLGLWEPLEDETRDGKRFVKFARLRDASPEELSTVACPRNDADKEHHRSESETAHAEHLASLMPDGFWLDYETTRTVGLGREIVIDGVFNDWASDGYTIDFQLTAPDLLWKVYVESKATYEEATTEKALMRCLSLRDHARVRVYTLYGHGSGRGWIDFGLPGEQWRVCDACPLAFPRQ